MERPANDLLLVEPFRETEREEIGRGKSFFTRRREMRREDWQTENQSRGEKGNEKNAGPGPFLEVHRNRCIDELVEKEKRNR